MQFISIWLLLVTSVAAVYCTGEGQMELIKTCLRSTMSDICLSSLAMLSIESVHTESINMDTFVDEFDSRHTVVNFFFIVYVLYRSCFTYK